MRPITPAGIAALSLLLFAAGCGGGGGDGAVSGDDALSNSNPNLPANKDRIAIIVARLPQIATDAAQQFAKDTQTTVLTDLVSAACTGKPFVETDVPSVMLTGCKFVFKDGKGTTTFSGNASAYIILKGQPDPTVPNDPTTNKEVPATSTKISFVGSSDIFVSDGIVPALATPIDIGDKAALEALGSKLVSAEEGSKVDVGLGAASDCSEVDDGKIKFPSGTTKKCFTWSNDRWQGQTVVAFDVVAGKAVGMRWVGFGGND